MNFDGDPFAWDARRRECLKAELDAAFFHLYNISRNDVDFVLDSFPIVKKSEEKSYGEYRTKLNILKFYDEIGKSISSGVAFEGSKT